MIVVIVTGCLSSKIRAQRMCSWEEAFDWWSSSHRRNCSWYCSLLVTIAIKLVIYISCMCVIFKSIKLITIVSKAYDLIFFIACCVVGFKFSRASYLLSLLRPQVADELELKVHAVWLSLMWQIACSKQFWIIHQHADKALHYYAL